MQIIEKYVLKSYVVSLVACVTLLIVLGVIGDILGFLDDIFKNNIPLPSIFMFYFYLAPFAFVNMIPFAALLSASFVFNTLSKNHEVTAVVASGVSLWKMLRPILVVTFMLCLSTFIINDRVVPSSMHKANQIRYEKLERGKEEKSGLIKNLAVYGRGDRIIFAKTYNPFDKILNNVIIHKQDQDHNITHKISARQIHREEDKWVARDVIIFPIGPDGKNTGDPEVHKRKDIHIEETPSDFARNQWDPRFMSYEQLRKYMKMFQKNSPEMVRRFKVELNYKIAFPFTALIILLVGVPFSVETGRANALIGIARGVGIAMCYLPVMAITMAMGKGGALPPFVAAWSTNIVFALIGVYFVYKKS